MTVGFATDSASEIQNGQDWFTPKCFALLLSLLIFATFPQVLLGTQTFFYRDYGALAYPAVAHHHQRFWHGEVPLWNPLNHCGVPFLAQWGTMVLYPPSLIYLLLPLPWSLGLFDLAHFFFGGLGMYFLANRWVQNRFAAGLAGLVYTFNGLNLSSLMWPNHQIALGWLPWVVLLTERAWRDGGKALLAAAVGGAMQMLSGVPETVLLTWLFLAGLFLSEWITARTARGTMAVRVLAVVLLITGLTAIQLLPFADLLAHSQRDRGYGDNESAMPGWGWANFLAPLFNCYRVTQGLFFQIGQEFYSSYYLGAGTVVLALLGLHNHKSRRVRVLLAFTALGLALAPGDNSFVFAGLKKAIPLVGVARYPVKFLVWVGFAVPLLAAFGIRRFCLHSNLDESRRALRSGAWVVASALVAMSAIVWFAHQFPLNARTQAQSPALGENTLWRAMFLVLTAGVVWRLLGANRRPVRFVLQLGVLVLLWRDVVTHAPSQNPTLPSFALKATDVRLEPKPEHGKSRVMLSPWAEVHLLYSRVPDFLGDLVGKRLAFWLNFNLIDGIPRIGGAFTLQLRESAEVESVLYKNIRTDLPRLADFLSVSHMTKPDEIVEWMARTNYLPMTTAGQQPIFAESSQVLQQLAQPTFDARRVVYLPAWTKPSISVTNRAQAEIISSNFRAQRVELAVQARDPSWVVLSQTYSPAWKARVDGRSVPLWPANHAFQALEVPAGPHQVVLTYEDYVFYIGSIISILTLAGCLFNVAQASLPAGSGGSRTCLARGSAAASAALVGAPPTGPCVRRGRRTLHASRVRSPC